ncbi:hypothetical protein EJ066_27005 [Mesorhizobium sp. M9A.F.Ca.ET.002.03.1.2]|nr:hypothetical protein EJ066_27005 [Mesorhizobium sp. M9A.F.Ca.ET.002.03.1.2]
MARAKRRSGDFGGNDVTLPRPLFVILGRSKERSDAAQTLGSIPLPPSITAVRSMAPSTSPCLAYTLNRLRPSADVKAWILGSAHAASRVLRPRMTKARLAART